MSEVIELHGAKTGNTLRASIALEEAGLAYRVVFVDLAGGQQRSGAHLALNPAGKVPTIIECREGQVPFVLSQSNAIMLYAASKVPGKLTPVDDPQKLAIFYERLFYFACDVIAPSHAGFYLKGKGETGTGPDLLRQQSIDALAAANRFVDSSRYIAGDAFSLADISAFTIAQASADRIDWSLVPQFKRWFDEVGQRAAVKRGVAAFDAPP